MEQTVVDSNPSGFSFSWPEGFTSPPLSPSPSWRGVHPEGISLDPEIFGIEGHPEGEIGHLTQMRGEVN